MGTDRCLARLITGTASSGDCQRLFPTAAREEEGLKEKLERAASLQGLDGHWGPLWTNDGAAMVCFTFCAFGRGLEARGYLTYLT
jgi:hypothetical protein